LYLLRLELVLAFIEGIPAKIPMEPQTNVNPEDVVRKALDAWNLQGLEGYISMLDPDYTIHDPSFPQPIKGREAVRKLNESVLRAMPDLKFKILTVMSKGDLAAVEYMMSGTFKGPLEFSGRIIPPTGRHLELQAMALWRANSKGFLAEVRNYSYGLAGLLQQIGTKA
jgi:predicted SnoaL-like aldol condensation-catalyzing enzyme